MERPDIVVGWVLVGAFSEEEQQAVRTAQARVLRRLRRDLADYTWRTASVRRRGVALTEGRAELVTLLDVGAAERDLGEWDYAMVVTAVDLRARHRTFALGAPSQTLDTAVMLIARLDPALRNDSVSAEERKETIARRLTALQLHLFGHLVGLEHRGAPEALM